MSADRMTRIAILLAVVAALASGCASIPDPPMPQGAVTRQQILDYQSALIATQRARDERHLRVTRAANAFCHTADIVTTVIAVKGDYGLREGNPLLPDPAKNTEGFVAVKLSIAWLLDREARKGYQTEVRTVAGVTCGVSLWNIAQMLK